jgi:hypothetical protein
MISLQQVANIILYLLGNMPPSLLVDDSAHHGNRNSKLISKVLLGDATGSIFFSDRMNGLIGKFRRSATFAASLTSFPHFIVVVADLRSKEQMFRAHASRSIAVVQNIHTVWNWAEMNLPGNAVYVENRSYRPFSFVDPSVPIMTLPNPEPAPFRLDDFPPETIGKRLLKVVMTAAAAKRPATFPDETWRSHKTFSTDKTGAFNLGRLTWHAGPPTRFSV